MSSMCLIILLDLLSMQYRMNLFHLGYIVNASLRELNDNDKKKVYTVLTNSAVALSECPARVELVRRTVELLL